MKTHFYFILVLIFLCLSCTKSDFSKPKTLLFSPIDPEYLRDTAAKWKATGFDGFLLSGIMSNWADDIWARDGDSTTRGADDLTFQRVKACNDECKKQGIEDNFIKIAFYSHIPLWTDDQAWKRLCQNFYEAARFAKESGCRGIALDIEYVSEQYELDWEGYDYQGYTKSDLHEAAGIRGQELIQTMLKGYPDMIYLNLPEGITYYGPLAADLFSGMVQAMANANAPGGMYLLTEASYNMTSTIGLIHYARNLDSKILAILNKNSAEYWMNNCSIALGGWPLGYYRKIYDEKGEFLGYGGKKEKFGDKVVGSYADKSSRFSVEDFRNQYAGLLLGSGRYCWIYGHGATWWQYSDEDIARYGERKNAALPVDENLNGYKAVLREKWMSTSEMKRISEKMKNQDTDDFMRYFNFIQKFMVVGPFGCKTCDNFNQEFPPEKQIDFESEYQSGTEVLSWQVCSVDPETGYLDFLKYIQPTEWVCSYAYCKIISPKTMPAQIRAGTNDSGILWFNGEKIISRNIERSAVLDDDIQEIQLQEGENTILLKVCNTEVNWGLYLRITDTEGNPLTNLKYWPE
jgi:hypothetical protein